MSKENSTALLRVIPLTRSEQQIVDKACRKADGSKLPRPIFYHDAIVQIAKQISEETAKQISGETANDEYANV